MEYPIHNIPDTWTNAGNRYDGIKIEVTDSGHANNSTLLDLSRNTVSRFSVDPDGNVTTVGTIEGPTIDELRSLSSSGVDLTSINQNVASLSGNINNNANNILANSGQIILNTSGIQSNNFDIALLQSQVTTLSGVNYVDSDLTTTENRNHTFNNNVTQTGAGVKIIESRADVDIVAEMQVNTDLGFARIGVQDGTNFSNIGATSSRVDIGNNQGRYFFSNDGGTTPLSPIDKTTQTTKRLMVDTSTGQILSDEELDKNVQVLTSPPLQPLEPGCYILDSSTASFSIELQNTIGSWRFVNSNRSLSTNAVTITSTSDTFTDAAGNQVLGDFILNEDGIIVEFLNPDGGNNFYTAIESTVGSVSPFISGGSWDASTNTPDLSLASNQVDPDGNLYIYNISNTGSQNIGQGSVLYETGGEIKWFAAGVFRYDTPLQVQIPLTQIQVEDETDTNFGLVSGERLKQSIVSNGVYNRVTNNQTLEVGKKYLVTTQTVNVPTSPQDGDWFVVKNDSDAVSVSGGDLDRGTLVGSLRTPDGFSIPSFPIGPNLEFIVTYTASTTSWTAALMNEQTIFLRNIHSTQELRGGTNYEINGTVSDMSFRLPTVPAGTIRVRASSSTIFPITIEDFDAGDSTPQILLEDGTVNHSFEIPLTRINQQIDIVGDTVNNLWRVYRPWEIDTINNNSIPWSPSTVYTQDFIVSATDPNTGVLNLYSRTTAGTSGLNFDSTEEANWTEIGAVAENLEILQSIAVTVTGYFSSYTIANNLVFVDADGVDYSSNDFEIIEDTGSALVGRVLQGVGFNPPTNGSRTIKVRFTGTSTRRGLSAVKLNLRTSAPSTGLTKVETKYFSGNTEVYTRSGGDTGAPETYILQTVFDFLTDPSQQTIDAGISWDTNTEYVGSNNQQFRFTMPSTVAAGPFITADGVTLGAGKTYNLYYLSDRTAADSVAAIADDAATVAEVSLMNFIGEFTPPSEEGLRGAPVDDLLILGALEAREYEQRLVKSNNNEYVFKLTADLTAEEIANTHNIDDNNTTGKWILQTDVVFPGDNGSIQVGKKNFYYSDETVPDTALVSGVKGQEFVIARASYGVGSDAATQAAGSVSEILYTRDNNEWVITEGGSGSDGVIADLITPQHFDNDTTTSISLGTLEPGNYRFNVSSIVWRDTISERMGGIFTVTDAGSTTVATVTQRMENAHSVNVWETLADVVIDFDVTSTQEYTLAVAGIGASGIALKTISGVKYSNGQFVDSNSVISVTLNEAFGITANEEAVVLEGIEVRLSQTAAQAQIRASTGSIPIEVMHALEQGSATEGGFGSKTLTTSWQDLDVTGETFTLSGAQERAHIRRTDNGDEYIVETRLGVGWNNNSIIIRKLGSSTVVNPNLVSPENGEAFAITQNDEELIFDGFRFKVRSAQAEIEIAAVTGTRNITDIHSRWEQTGESTAITASQTVTTTFARLGNDINFTVAGATQITYFNYNGTVYEVYMSVGNSFNNNVIKVRKVNQKTVIRPEDTLVNDQSSSSYIDIGNMRMQWGRDTSGSGNRTITLPASFGDTNYTVTTATDSGTGAIVNDNSVRSAHVGNKTTSQFTMRVVFVSSNNEGTTGEPFSWMAIGTKPI